MFYMIYLNPIDKVFSIIDQNPKVPVICPCINEHIRIITILILIIVIPRFDFTNMHLYLINYTVFTILYVLKIN